MSEEKTEITQNKSKKVAFILAICVAVLFIVVAIVLIIIFCKELSTGKSVEDIITQDSAMFVITPVIIIYGIVRLTSTLLKVRRKNKKIEDKQNSETGNL